MNAIPVGFMCAYLVNPALGIVELKLKLSIYIQKKTEKRCTESED